MKLYTLNAGTMTRYDATSSMSISTDTAVRADKQLRVAIVGGGVCGLTCALALAREGIRAEVFEAAVSHSTHCGVSFSDMFCSQNLERLELVWVSVS